MRTLEHLETLDRILADRSGRPALVFKHSLTCGTSAMALEEVQELIDGPDIGADVYVLRLQTARDVSRAIEDRLGVRHESPQAVLVVDGRVVWHASHFRVTAAAIHAAIRKHQGAAVP